MRGRKTNKQATRKTGNNRERIEKESRKNGERMANNGKVEYSGASVEKGQASVQT